jgi:OmcA/MtrC family decaheme c-type cytochrome
VQACVVCHAVAGSVSRSAGGDRLTAYVHGIHNSKEMPARSITASLAFGTPPVTASYTVAKPAGVYARNDSLSATSATTAVVSSPFSVGFPSYMINCSNCHDSAARLAAIMAMPVSFSTCMSCHDDWTGFPAFQPGNPSYSATQAATHTALVRPAAGTATANACATCHNGTAAPGTVGAYHGKVQFATERAGLVYDGVDQSVALGKNLAMTITSVGYSADATPKLVVKWTATYNGVAVNPCQSNTDLGPVFIGVTTANPATGLVVSNMSILQAYAQGNDWVNAGIGTSVGQPVSANLDTTNTVCASNEATSTVAVALNIPAWVTKGIVSIQGKPQVTFTSGTYSRVAAIRSTSPVREFTVGTGAVPTALRRQIVSNAKCLACHTGSLYQHGGNRIDSIDLCVMCHDPASNEKYYRLGTLGLTAANTYDGKVGETIDMRTMIHAIHSAGETGKALVYYRSNGAYFFGSQAALAANTLWPTTGGISCTNTEGVVSTYYRVPGSLNSGVVPEVNTDGTCRTGTVNSTNGTWLAHNFIEVHYPRALNDCAACHINGSEQGFGNQAERMAVTVDPGNILAANRMNQLDDVLRGAGAQSCFTCHQSGDAATQAALQAHGTDHGFAPKAMAGGRADLIACALGDATKCP